MANRSPTKKMAVAADTGFQGSQGDLEGSAPTQGVLYRKLDYPKDAPVPVLVKLWGFEYSRQNTPERLFCRAMTDQAGDKLGIDQHASPAKILEDRDLKFVVMLDGLDEIPRRQRLRTVKALAGFVQDHPHARFIITCRSDLLQDMGPEWGAYSQLRIESMTPVQARQYLGGTVWESLLDRDDILTSTLQLLCNPRRINALREAERPVQSLGGVLEKAIEGFLAEEHKKYESDQRTRSRVESKTDLFAFCLLEQGLQEVGEETAREILKSSFDWLYRAGLLVLRDGCCGFTEPIVRDYFAARRLLNLYRNRKLAPVVQEIAAHPDQWFGAIAIAVNIWRDDITAEPMASLLVILQPGHRLQAVAERRFSSINNVAIIETALNEYLQQPGVDLALIERLLQDQDLAVRRATVKAIGEARYTPAAEALYDMSSQLPEGDELRWLIGAILTQLDDPRGRELQRVEEAEGVEEQETTETGDKQIGADRLESSTLAQIGG